MLLQNGTKSLVVNAELNRCVYLKQIHKLTNYASSICPFALLFEIHHHISITSITWRWLNFSFHVLSLLPSPLVSFHDVHRGKIKHFIYLGSFILSVFLSCSWMMFGMHYSAVVCVYTVNRILQTQTLCWFKGKTTIPCEYTVSDSGDSLLLVPSPQLLCQTKRLYA